MPIDYSKTIIYKICCKDTLITDIYIGSTCNFHRRKTNHKSNCNNLKREKSNYNVYQFIREHGGWNNWDMIMIAEASVENKLQKEKLEREYIEDMKPTLNSIIPTRTIKEYRKDNEEKIAETKKEWYENNKAKLIEKQKLYRKANKEKILAQQKEKFDCECGGKYTNAGKSQHMKTKKHQDYINSI